MNEYFRISFICLIGIMLSSWHFKNVDFKLNNIIYQNKPQNIIDEINKQGDTSGFVLTVYSGKQKIGWFCQNDSTYYLRDYTKGKGIITLHGNRNLNADYISCSPQWNLDSSEQYALDVHYGVSQTYLFYKKLFNRNSIDDNGYAIYSYVNDTNTPNNAIWDGAALRFGIQTSTNKCISSLDIIGHELTHAIISYTSGLHSGGESGAVCESICDIMGKSIEFWSNPNDSNWIISRKMNFEVRDLSKPKKFKQPDTYKDPVYWYTGSSTEKNDHTNSCIGNYMFYLLAHGGSGRNSFGKSYQVTGIGLGAADSIIYRTVTVYLKSDAQYCDWRDACLKAVVDIYGTNSNQFKSTAAAWAAVNVPSCEQLYQSK